METTSLILGVSSTPQHTEVTAQECGPCGRRLFSFITGCFACVGSGASLQTSEVTRLTGRRGRGWRGPRCRPAGPGTTEERKQTRCQGGGNRPRSQEQWPFSFQSPAKIAFSAAASLAGGWQTEHVTSPRPPFQRVCPAAGRWQCCGFCQWLFLCCPTLPGCDTPGRSHPGVTWGSQDGEQSFLRRSLVNHSKLRAARPLTGTGATPWRGTLLASDTNGQAGVC